MPPSLLEQRVKEILPEPFLTGWGAGRPWKLRHGARGGGFVRDSAANDAACLGTQISRLT